MDSPGVTLKKKVILLGDGSVGKTSLIRKFVQDRFEADYTPTIGTQLSKKTMEVNGQKVVLMIWDVLGQDGYTEVHRLALEGADGAVVVADLTDMRTLVGLTAHWIPLAKNISGSIPMVMIGNKADLESRRQWGKIDIEQHSRAHHTPFFFTSALTGQNVETVFEALTRLIITGEYIIERVLKPIPKVTTIDTQEQLVDSIMVDFIAIQGDQSAAMDLLREAFDRAGVDIRAPENEEVERLIREMEALETHYLGVQGSAMNRDRRMSLLARVNGGRMAETLGS